MNGSQPPVVPWEWCECGRIIPINEVCECPAGMEAYEVWRRRWGIPDSEPVFCAECGDEVFDLLNIYQKGYKKGHAECLT